MNKYISQVLSLAYFFFIRLSWVKAWRLYDRKSKNVLWIHPAFPFQLVEYLGRSIIFYEWAHLDAMVRNGQRYRIVLGRKIGKTHGSNIFYHASHEFMNIFKFEAYPSFLVGTIQALEEQNNMPFASAGELAYWENKAYMHRQFDALGVSQPETYILSPKELPAFQSLSYPYILKEIHSQGSKGLHKITGPDDLATAARKLQEEGHQQVLAQRIVGMTRDLRVTIVGSEVVLAYWRINPEKEWRPTSTSRGSSVDFGNFPEQWRGYFLEITQRLGLRAAAYDVCWEGDDVTTMPIILEVSPYFQPNPPLPAHLQHMAYRDYKKTFFTKQPFFKTRVDAYCAIADKKIKCYLNL